jgi:hypothetical protein
VSEHTFLTIPRALWALFLIATCEITEPYSSPCAHARVQPVCTTSPTLTAKYKVLIISVGTHIPYYTQSTLSTLSHCHLWNYRAIQLSVRTCTRPTSLYNLAHTDSKVQSPNYKCRNTHSLLYPEHFEHSFSLPLVKLQSHTVFRAHMHGQPVCTTLPRMMAMYTVLIIGVGTYQTLSTQKYLVTIIRSFGTYRILIVFCTFSYWSVIITIFCTFSKRP